MEEGEERVQMDIWEGGHWGMGGRRGGLQIEKERRGMNRRGEKRKIRRYG